MQVAIFIDHLHHAVDGEALEVCGSQMAAEDEVSEPWKLGTRVCLSTPSSGIHWFLLIPA